MTTNQNSGIFVGFSGAAGNQFGRSIYTTTMPFKAVERFLVVFPDVQRKINKKRAKNIADYIIKGLKPNNFCFLSSITVSCRGDIQYNEATNTVNIDINAQLSVNDGQHRVEGIKIALAALRKECEKASRENKEAAEEKLERLENMCIPVVIFSGMDKTKEQQLFHDLNLLQNKPTKSVSLKFDNTDLYNAMAKELMNECEPLTIFGVETERTSLSEKNPEIMVLSTLRNMISYIVAGSDKDSNELLNLDNYQTKKEEVSEIITEVFANLPSDANDRTKYILGIAITMQGIGKYCNYLLENESITDISSYLRGLRSIDWRHQNPMWNNYGGSFDVNKQRFVFGGTGGGITGVCNALIRYNTPAPLAS